MLDGEVWVVIRRAVVAVERTIGPTQVGRVSLTNYGVCSILVEYRLRIDDSAAAVLKR